MRAYFRIKTGEEYTAIQLVAALIRVYSDEINDSAEFGYRELAGGEFEVAVYRSCGVVYHRVRSALLKELNAFSDGFIQGLSVGETGE